MAELFEVVRTDGGTEILLPPSAAKRRLAALGFGAGCGAVAAPVVYLAWTDAGLTEPPAWAAAIALFLLVLAGAAAVMHRRLTSNSSRVMCLSPAGRATFGLHDLVEAGTAVGVRVHELEDSEDRPTFAVLVVVRGERGRWLPVPDPLGNGCWKETVGAGFDCRIDAERYAAVVADALGLPVPESIAVGER